MRRKCKAASHQSSCNPSHRGRAGGHHGEVSERHRDRPQALLLDTLVAIANCLEVEPYELLLPENRGISYDSHRTQVMMEQLKSDFTRMVDTIGTFLEEGRPTT